MAGSVNKVILVGNVGQDPEVRQFQNGGQVCSFSLATSENWKDKNTGERREKTEWHRISVFNEGLIRVVQSYVKKGSKLYIEGQLETRQWQDQTFCNICAHLFKKYFKFQQTIKPKFHIQKPSKYAKFDAFGTKLSKLAALLMLSD